MGSSDFLMQPVAFDVADDFAVEVDLVQVAAAVVEVVDAAAVGKNGLNAVAERVVLIAYRCALAVVDGGFADESVEYVVNEFDAAVAVAGFDQIAGQRVVVETGAAVVFALFGGNERTVDAAAGFFRQIDEKFRLLKIIRKMPFEKKFSFGIL
ncbi:hypothetical protein [Neisseria wadsworthii]|uniref:hypothetical protein n=1 Tax=Neisseria wadsworthii TaxID=607711 RepID=UPI0002F430EE